MGVVVPYGKGHLGGPHAAQAQKLLGLADAQGREVFGEGIACLLGKKTVERRLLDMQAARATSWSIRLGSAKCWDR